MDKTKREAAEQAFIDFARRLLREMRGWAASSGIPQYHDVKVVFSDEGTNEAVLKRPFFLRFLAQNDPNGDWRVAAATLCVELHVEAGLFRADEVFNFDGKPIHNPSGEQLARQYLPEIQQPILDAIEQTDSLDVNVALIRKRYRLYRAVWESSSTKMRCTLPIVNLQSETSFRISPSIELLPFTHEEKTDYYARIGGLHSGVTKFLDFRQARFKLSGRFFFNEAEGLGFGKFFYEVTTFLRAMRLLKPGVVGATALTYQRDIPLDLPTGGLALNDFAIPLGHAEPYRLLKKDVAPLKALFRNLLRQHQLKGLNVALGRFNQSYSRTSAEDKIIDLTIALESCLLAGEVPPEEIAYKFALRGAAIITKLNGPAYTFSFLRYVYSLRSKIVHEGRSLWEEKRFDPPAMPGVQVLKKDVCPLYEDYVRLILKKYVEQLVKGLKVSAVNTELDRKIVTTLRRMS